MPVPATIWLAIFGAGRSDGTLRRRWGCLPPACEMDGAHNGGPANAGALARADVAERGTRIPRNDPIRSCADCRAGMAGVTAGSMAGLAAERGIWISRNDPIRGCVGRPTGMCWVTADSMAGGGARVPNAHSAQRPYTRLCGSAEAGWLGFVRDGVAGGCGGARNSQCAQRPYTRPCWSVGAGWLGFAPDGVAGGCGGARNSDWTQRPYTGMRGAAGPGWSGSVRSGALANVARRRPGRRGCYRWGTRRKWRF